MVERGNGYAIDDLRSNWLRAMPDTLITAAEALNGVRVDSVRPHTGLLAHRELELLDHVAAARPHGPGPVNEAPCELVHGALRSSWELHLSGRQPRCAGDLAIYALAS